jgi:hypothetical protein
MPTCPLKVQIYVEKDNIWQTRSYNMLPLMLAEATTRALGLHIFITPNIRSDDYLAFSREFRDVISAPLGGGATNGGRSFDIQRRRRLWQDLKSG